MSVLSSIKGKIINVQQDLSESLRSLTTVIPKNKSPQTHVQFRTANSNGSVELLSRYQNSWSKVHEASEEVALKGQNVDNLIASIFQFMDQRNTAVNQFVAEMSAITHLVSDIETVKEKIVSLEGAFDALESMLIELEDLSNQRDLIKKQMEHEYQLKKYRQNKHLELEQVKVGLAKKHATKVQQYEEHLSATLRERQKVFDEAHQEQMMKYMTTGQVDCLPASPSHSVSLADVKIDEDEDELKRFLDSVEDVTVSPVKVDGDVEEVDDDVTIESSFVQVKQDVNEEEEEKFVEGENKSLELRNVTDYISSNSDQMPDNRNQIEDNSTASDPINDCHVKDIEEESEIL